MTLKLSYFLLIISSLLTLQGQAFQASIVVCPDKILSLDLWEAQVLGRLKLNPQTGPWENYFIFLEKLFPHLNLETRTLFMESLKNFKNETVNPPSNAKDDLFLVPHKSCHIRPILEVDKTLKTGTLDRELWTRLDRQNQAAILSNVLLQSEVARWNPQKKGTVYIRSLNAQFFSSEFFSLSSEFLIRLSWKAALGEIYLQNVLINLKKNVHFFSKGQISRATPQDGFVWKYKNETSLRLKGDEIPFYENGNPKSLRFYDLFTLKIHENSISFSTPDQFSKTPFESEQFPRLYFYPDLSIERGLILSKINLKFPHFLLQTAQNTTRFEAFPSSLIFFHPQHIPALITNTTGWLWVQNRKILIHPKTSVEFYPKGQPKSLTVKEPLPLLGTDKRTHWAEGPLEFTEQGWLK